MTSLFCDLVGFTASSEGADPEDVDRMLAAYFDVARAQIEGHGGTVEKFIGDAVVGVFGVPVAHEDDPERAVRAGLRIVEEAERLHGVGDAPLRLRVGINTGEALVRLGVEPRLGRGLPDRGRGQHRVQDPVGGTRDGCRSRAGDLRGDVSRVRLRGAGTGQPEGEVGAGQGVPRTLSARAVRDGSDPDARQPVRRPRDRPGDPEGDLRQDGRGQLGAAGDGGRRAWAWEEPACRRAVRVHRRAAGPGHLAAGPLPALRGGDHLLGAGGDPEGPYGDPRIRPARCGCGEAGRGAAGGTGARPGSGSGCCRCWGSRPPQSAEREELFTAWRRFLELVAEERPTVLVFEDLHWADEAMLAFLEHLADLAEGVPLLLGRHRAARAVRAAPRLRREAPKRHHDQPGAALAGGDRPARLGAAWTRRCCRPSCSSRSSSVPAATRSMRRSSCGC